MLIDFYFTKIYGDAVDEHIECARKLCLDLVKEYELKGVVLSGGQDVGLEIVHLESFLNLNKYWNVYEFKTFRNQNKRVKVTKLKLDKYLDEELLDITMNFDILGFWKMHTRQYPILSELTKDILTIHVSVVASTTTSSVGNRFLSLHLSKLHHNTLQSLMCAQNWIWASTSQGIKLFELYYNNICLLKMFLNLNLLFLLLGEVLDDEIFVGEEVILNDDVTAQLSNNLT